MHQAGHVVLVLRLDGHHEAVVALGDDGLLEIFCLVGGEELVEDVPHLGGGGPDMPPDGSQLGNGNLTSAQNGSVGGYMVKKMIENQERQMAGK